MCVLRSQKVSISPLSGSLNALINSSLYCNMALMSACIVTGDPTDIGTCDPAVFRLSGDDGYEIRDPVRRVVWWWVGGWWWWWWWYV